MPRPTASPTRSSGRLTTVSEQPYGMWTSLTSIFTQAPMSPPVHAAAAAQRVREAHWWCAVQIGCEPCPSPVTSSSRRFKPARPHGHVRTPRPRSIPRRGRMHSPLRPQRADPASAHRPTRARPHRRSRCTSVISPPSSSGSPTARASSAPSRQANPRAATRPADPTAASDLPRDLRDLRDLPCSARCIARRPRRPRRPRAPPRCATELLSAPMMLRCARRARLWDRRTQSSAAVPSGSGAAVLRRRRLMPRGASSMDERC